MDISDSDDGDSLLMRILGLGPKSLASGLRLGVLVLSQSPSIILLQRSELDRVTGIVDAGLLNAAHDQRHCALCSIQGLIKCSQPSRKTMAM